MTYIILETQTTAGTTAIVPPVAFTDRQQAESRFHSVLASAAISSIEEHSCLLLTSDGKLVRSECYRHVVEAEPAE